MAIKIQTYGTEPYFLATFVEQAAIEDFTEIVKTVQNISNVRKKTGLPHRIWYIADIRGLNFTFDQITDSLNILRKQDSTIMQPVVVGGDSMAHLGIKAIEQKQYGAWEALKIFATPEEAIAFAKKQNGR
jgi:hypothetical protein